MLDGGEGVHSVGVVLLGVEGSSNTVVQGDKSTSVTSLGLSSKSDGLQEVGRPVSRDGSGGPHGANNDDGFTTVNNAVHCRKESGQKPAQSFLQ